MTTRLHPITDTQNTKKQKHSIRNELQSYNKRNMTHPNNAEQALVQK